MDQFETVCKGLECHVTDGKCGLECPYFCNWTCTEQLCLDAVSMLKQQQERIKSLEGRQQRMISTNVFVYSPRYALGNVFEKWATENGADICYENFMTFLCLHGMIDNEAVKKFLRKEEENE